MASGAACPPADALGCSGDEATWADYCKDQDGDQVKVLGGDCDDNAATNFPGNPEVCDGLDNGCDGKADYEVSSGTWAGCGDDQICLGAEGCVDAAPCRSLAAPVVTTRTRLTHRG